MKKHRAFLKWAGGKYTLVEKITKCLPEGEQLIEPFVGAGSVFLNTNYESYILSDINQDLISLFKIIKRSPQKFIQDAKLLFTEQNNTAPAFYELRDLFNQSDSEYQRSLLFLYLNRHCYNGLCRYNSSGEFNVPFGQYKKIYFPESEIHYFAEKAKNAQFICTSYEKAMKKARTGSVVYCDPPYEPLSDSANFTAYYANGFSNVQQKNLALLAEKIAAKYQVPVLISNNDTENTRVWYKNATIFSVETRRSISRNGDGRNKIDELLALYR
ncbi:Dam family site-specific DNA-(adenine-N6)-methyltransferase [Zophobihabitans entericus]|uniref:Site-specific DNA-methyltransferase (adenine-specific) n=1 Tax=Zophobihabitans entericus TaxID=1635327 RepID=A0A6G9I9U7_9GAMM|nr:Dam family site-specific DNA-(adenine-N6)-methyltransferase [Zophobihabitans entericus]QIQ20609.1 Dam family site-specific DNA-(adenine-N6)-methyltransferase [Zophobihabitans entericus]